MTWAAVILTGGTGSRLGGVDKASLEVAGLSLLEHVGYQGDECSRFCQLSLHQRGRRHDDQCAERRSRTVAFDKGHDVMKCPLEGRERFDVCGHGGQRILRDVT